jgi:hypothetical protein
MSSSPSRQPDEEQCRAFNADIVRTLVARKMMKQKTFYELKVMSSTSIPASSPTSPIIPTRNVSAAQQHFSAGLGAGNGAVYMRSQHRISMNSPPQVRRIIHLDTNGRSNSRILNQ